MKAYPLFQPIEKADQRLFDAVLNNDPPSISEFTFTNLYSWREAYQLTAAMFGGMVILRSDKETLPRFFNPIGRGNKKDAIKRILEQSDGHFIRIPEETATLFNNDDTMIVEEDRDNSDYVYTTGDLIALQGVKFDGKRNLIKKFKSMHQYEYMTLGQSTVTQILEFETAWCSVKDCDAVEGLSNERSAIHEMAANFSDFNLIGGAILVQDKTVAVSIGQHLNPRTLVMHVLKAQPTMTGLYQVILNEFLSHEAKEFEYVNMEQDLGIEGLRKAKLSYHPVRMIKKYTLKKKEVHDGKGKN